MEPDERDVFSKLAPFSDAEAAHLCRLVLMKALPALAECDIAGFGSAIKEMQMLIGDYFAAIQGGSRFSSPDVAAALAALEDEGAYGIGQSSWGPTGFAFAPSAEEAEPSAREHPPASAWPGSGHSCRQLVSIAARKSSAAWRRTSLSDTKDKNQRVGEVMP